MDRKDLTKTGDRTDQFFGSRFGELGNKHGPIYWLLAPKKAFDRDDVDSFLDRLPCELHGRALRRAIGAWHDSFATLAFVKLAREWSVAVISAESGGYPGIANLTTEDVYARLRRSRQDRPTGYPSEPLDRSGAGARC